MSRTSDRFSTGTSSLAAYSFSSSTKPPRAVSNKRIHCFPHSGEGEGVGFFGPYFHVQYLPLPWSKYEGPKFPWVLVEVFLKAVIAGKGIPFVATETGEVFRSFVIIGINNETPFLLLAQVAFLVQDVPVEILCSVGCFIVRPYLLYEVQALVLSIP